MVVQTSVEIIGVCWANDADNQSLLVVSSHISCPNECVGKASRPSGMMRGCSGYMYKIQRPGWRVAANSEWTWWEAIGHSDEPSIARSCLAGPAGQKERVGSTVCIYY